MLENVPLYESDEDLNTVAEKATQRKNQTRQKYRLPKWTVCCIINLVKW
jgi:hypothetical protein